MFKLSLIHSEFFIMIMVMLGLLKDATKKYADEWSSVVPALHSPQPDQYDIASPCDNDYL